MTLSARQVHAALALGVVGILLVTTLLFAVWIVASSWRKAVTAARDKVQVVALQARRDKSLSANAVVRAQVEGVLGSIDVYRDRRISEMALRPLVLRLAGSKRSASSLPFPVNSASGDASSVELSSTINRSADIATLLQALQAVDTPGVRVREFRLQASTSTKSSTGTMRVAIVRFADSVPPEAPR